MTLRFLFTYNYLSLFIKQVQNNPSIKSNFIATVKKPLVTLHSCKYIQNYIPTLQNLFKDSQNKPRDIQKRR